MEKIAILILLLCPALCHAQRLDKDTTDIVNESLREAIILSSRNSRSADKSTNDLSTINGKPILILINGIQATDDDLKLIPANKIRYMMCRRCDIWMRKITDLETGRYSYRIGNDGYEYDYSRENQSWGNQHSIGFSYLYSKESNYDLQITQLKNYSIKLEEIVGLNNFLVTFVSDKFIIP